MSLTVSEVLNYNLQDNVKNLIKLVGEFGYKDTYCTDGLKEFFRDNPGAMEAVADWIADNLAEPDSDDDDEEVEDEG